MEQKNYICSICGKPHPSIKEKAICELECCERLEKEEEQKRQEKLIIEKKERYDLINKKEKELFELKKAFDNDYGTNLSRTHCIGFVDNKGITSKTIAQMLLDNMYRNNNIRW